MTADEILKLNVNIGDPNKVFLGQRIRLSEERAPMFLAHPRLLASSRHYYKYLSLVLESIRPHSSLIAGGAMLTLQGSGFVSSHETCMTVCSFGGTRVAAKVLSSSEMLCLAPPRWQVFALQGSSADPRDGGCAGEVSCGQAAVEVSINGRDLTRSGLFLTYSRAPLCVLPMLEEGKLISRYRLFTSRVVLPVWSSSPSEKELESMRRSIQRWRILRGVADVALVALNSSLPSLLGLDGVHVIRQDPSSEADQAGGRSSLEEEAILLRRLVCMGLNDMDGKGEEQADYLTAASPFALLNVDFSVALSSLQAEGGNFSLIGRAPPRPLDHQSESENNSGDASARSKAVSASSVDFVAFPYSTVQSICKAENSLRRPLDLLRNEWTRLVDGSSSVSVEVGHGLQGFLGKTDPTSGTQPGKPRASMLDYANWVLRNC
uniref:LysM domain-containing protein n=1 Tax=Hanusia phi TaxID=3032 RepID=A0A7S0ND22_9CRYP